MTITTVGVGVVGAGGISDFVHLPGLAATPRARIVAICDTATESVTRLAAKYHIEHTFSDYQELIAHPDVDAIIVATPNHLHRPISLAALAAGKHVLSEKPLGLNFAETLEMADVADSSGLIAMTAFTYRYVPGMRYMKHLVDSGYLGTARHVRAVRFQDWGDRALGWRQVKALAGSGEIGDMGAHRIDYAQHLLGPIQRVVGQTRIFVPERRAADGTVTIADVDDWVGFLAEFPNGVTGVFEMSKLAAGRNEGNGLGLDQAEVNGSEGSLIYQLHRPHELQTGRPSKPMDYESVPTEFLTVPGAGHNPAEGSPLQTFRFNQAAAFIDAIVNGHPTTSAFASFRDGARCQAVVDAILQSSVERRWIDIPQI